MRRRFFNLNTLAALSFVLYVATTATWICSRDSLARVYWAKWAIGPVPPRARIVSIGGERGELYATYEKIDQLSPAMEQIIKRFSPSGFRADRFSTAIPGSSALRFFIRRGLGMEKSSTALPAFRGTTWTIRCPAWIPFVVFAVLPVMRLARLLRRPNRAGLCSACGYDLRASPDRCPECGTLVASRIDVKT